MRTENLCSAGRLASRCVAFPLALFFSANCLGSDQQNPPQHIFVFLDGTGNIATSDTNVHRLFEVVDSSTVDGRAPVSRYYRGIGTSGPKLAEQALGLEMQKRIIEGYAHIAEHYRPGDKIYIFGFSRGALEARSLAGLVAYAGIPRREDKSDVPASVGEDILRIVKKKSDKDFLESWKQWKTNDSPILSQEIKGSLGIDMWPAEVEFLGVWDTVPGSSFKNFALCKEKPGIRHGDRYKTDSYPSIKSIAHAVSIDEKRSKFRPLLVCQPIESERKTHVTETWFPGAHSDVGGGYGDDLGLPNISLNWMIGQLGAHYRFDKAPPAFQENALAPAHWSISHPEGGVGSHCEDRLRGPDRSPAEDLRMKESAVPLRIFKKNGKEVEVSRKYPVMCKDLQG